MQDNNFEKENISVDAQKNEISSKDNIEINEEFSAIDEQNVQNDDFVEEKENIIDSVENHRKSKKGKKSVISLLIRTLIIIASSIILASLVISGFKDIYGLNFTESIEKDVYIEKGSTTAQIAQTLKENGIVEQPLLFRLYCKLGNNGGFQYGYHTFDENMSYAQITNELKKLVKKKDVVEITVIEGWTLYDIAKELKEKDVIEDITDFTKAVERMSVTYDFISDVPSNQYRYYKYEGYFYPDKYEFYTGTTDYEGIAKKFFSNFVAHLDSDIKNAVKESKYSFDEILTLASIIQAEAGDVNEMGKVSSVFNNRLNNKAIFPRLQSDVTKFYIGKVFEKKEGEHFNEELYNAYNDAYNTYKIEGLTPGPICNPSKEAIRAALYPENTKYYFFVTDMRGKYYYANSLAKHNQNIAIVNRVNNSLKEGN